MASHTRKLLIEQGMYMKYLLLEYVIFAHARTEGDSTMAKRECTMVTVRQYDGDNTTVRW